MHALWDALARELAAEMPSADQFARVTVRLVFAMLLAAIVGWERERQGKAAGLRTHMLVALGAALFTVSTLESGANEDSVTRVIQGVATGIGFIGGGVILKLPQNQEIRGLTTAASVWLTAAMGVTAGLGRMSSALIGMAFAWFVLRVLERLEEHWPQKASKKASKKAKSAVTNGHDGDSEAGKEV